MHVYSKSFFRECTKLKKKRSNIIKWKKIILSSYNIRRKDYEVGLPERCDNIMHIHAIIFNKMMKEKC